MDWLAQHYDLLRGLHILAVIAWMAGMLYLPRLYVYHVRATPGGEAELMLRTMEEKLLRIIINPAMALTFLLGLCLVGADSRLRGGFGFLVQGWMLTKLGGIAFMSAWHGFLAASRRRFAAGENQRSERFWRLTNELPFLAAIIMVLAVTAFDPMRIA